MFFEVGGMPGYVADEDIVAVFVTREGGIAWKGVSLAIDCRKNDAFKSIGKCRQVRHVLGFFTVDGHKVDQFDHAAAALEQFPFFGILFR